MRVVENIFNDRINTNVIRHTTSGVDTIWTGVDHMVLDLISLDQGSNVQLDTSAVGEETTVDFTINGFLTFLLGDKSVTAGKYRVQLAAVDGSGNITQLIHYDKDFVVFKFSTTKTVT